MDESASIPNHGWKAKLNEKCRTKCSPFRLPRAKQLPPIIGITFRYIVYRLQMYREGKRPIMDHNNIIEHHPIYGVPLGGIGCGSIGRGYRGEFCRYNMVPGMYEYKVVHANQFIVCIRKHGKTVYHKVLNAVRPRTKLRAWDWSYNGEDGAYHGLYPQAWTVYVIAEHGVTLTCRQISPVIPHNYKDTCLPVGVFVWTIENKSAEPLEISLTLTWKNGQGVKSDRKPGVRTQAFRNEVDDNSPIGASGVQIAEEFNDMQCTYAVAAAHKEGCEVTHLLAWNPNGDGADLWAPLSKDGHLSDTIGSTVDRPPGQEVAVAVCSKCTIEAKSVRSMEFALAWDMPHIHFRSREVQYRKRYTRWFGHDGQAAPKLVSYGLNHHARWSREINAWQAPVLNNPKLPAWYKSALFNELYYLSDGGTLWLDPVDDVEAYSNWALPRLPQVMKDYGRFAYLEGHEYRMYNTYDVHHYGSFALVMLWPKLQLSLQYDIASATMTTDCRRIKYLMSGVRGVVKPQHAVPHDLGDPEDEPWRRFNCYNIHPTYEWRDLNPKFVLQVYRDFHMLQDREYLTDMYPVCAAVMEYSMKWDTDNDGLIENGGFADQTYDAWTATGVSAYCGGLWLSALRSIAEMARILDKQDDLLHYDALLQKGRVAFEKKLWNGEYYDYDTSTNGHHDSVMTDQLAGQWFLKASGIADDEVLPKSHVISALKKIYEWNVLPFKGGMFGAINGMKRSGKMDYSCVQSDEFWVGTTYGVGATMIQEGMVEEGMKTAQGAYHACYELYGLQYQTPEAYKLDKHFRSLGYMRPLTIWAVQHALEKYHPDIIKAVADEKGHATAE